MHQRQVIRDAVAMLLADLPTTRDRVYVGRTRALKAAHDPSLLIFTTEEASERGMDGQPGAIGRVLLLVIEGRTATSAPPDDLLDTIAEEVEAKMRDTNLRGEIFDATLMRTEIETSAPETARHIGSIKLAYSVRYNDPAEDE